MKNILSFRSTLPEDGKETEPRGYSICRVLENGLRQTGLKTNGLDNYNDFAWCLDCEIDGKGVWFFVGRLGLPAAEWQLIVCSRLPWWRRLFGQSDEPEMKELARAIHRVLASDSHFSDLRWSASFSPKGNHESFPNPE